MALAEHIIDFYAGLNQYNIALPAGIRIMNPYSNGIHSEIIQKLMDTFFKKYYSDNKPRRMILGINPGRFGAGQTGIMFTDTIRLNENCGIVFDEFRSYELSSEFFYKVVESYGGAQSFYRKFYIGAISPLGFVKTTESKKEINYNYYDNKDLLRTLQPYITQWIGQQIALGIDTEVCYCLGTGKNFNYLKTLNEEQKFFKSIIPLEHPRFVMQYRRKTMDEYINKYLEALRK